MDLPGLTGPSDHLFCWAKHGIKSSDYLYTHDRNHALRDDRASCHMLMYLACSQDK